MSTRLIYLIGLVIIIFLLLAGYYVQVYLGVMPCPLCILQRFSFGVLGILFFIGIFVHAKLWGRLVVNLLSLVTCLIGISLAGRQVWLQHFPMTINNECGVSLQYMMQVLPLHQVVQKIFEGTAECARQDWEFLNINMAEWSFIWFVLFALLILYLLLKEFKWR